MLSTTAKTRTDYPRREGLYHACKAAGLFCATYSPGDGVTRYRFFTEPTDFHAGDGLYTALGRKEAITFLQGIIIGKRLTNGSMLLRA